MNQKRLLTSRLYQNEQDLVKMMDMLMIGRSRTNDWHYAHVGELLFNFFMVFCHLNPQQHIRLWFDKASNLVGYAMLGEDPSFDWQMLPEYEWTGIEEEAFGWVEAVLSELRERAKAQWSGSIVSSARQDDIRRIQFLEQGGFHYSGNFAEVNMLRSLSEPIPDSKIPVGYHVTTMVENNNIPDRAAAQREVWQPWTVGNVSNEDYVHFMQLPGYYSDLDVVSVTPDGVIAAYVNGWTDPLNRIGDFGPVGARPAYRRKGLTRLALLEGMRRMQSYGMDRVCISTGIVNTPALELYSSLGFTTVNRYLDYVKDV